VMPVSVERWRSRIARFVREQVETNAAASLDAIQAHAHPGPQPGPVGRDPRPAARAHPELYAEYQRANEFDYDDVVEQSFPASDPPPPPAP